MNRTEDSKVRQGSRVITAAARQAVAGEKARIAGKKARQPSALEEAAAEWEKEREARARNADERPGILRQVEMCPFSFQQMQLSGDGAEAQDDAVWKLYGPRRDEEKGATTVIAARTNLAGVGALSRRLMAIERARALGQKPVDLRSWALELEARRWREERARRR